MPLLSTLLRSPGFHFALFVFWLLSLPMGGPLLELFADPVAPTQFLVPLILTLLLAWRIPERRQKSINFAAGILCALCTLLLLSPFASPWLLSVMAVSSTLICLKLCCRLAESTRPIAAAAFGLFTANFLLYLMVALEMPLFFHALIAALAIFVSGSAETAPNRVSGAISLKPYLLCLLIFHVTSGLMYGYVLPHYQQLNFLPGIELLFYLLAIPFAYCLSRYGHDTLLVVAIGLAMLAFSLLIEASSRYFISSMFSLQAAAGFSDLFVLVWIISVGGGTKEFGYALGSVCAGNLIGQYLNQPSAATMPGAVLIGNLALSLALLMLYLMKKNQLEQFPAGEQQRVETAEPLHQQLHLVPVNISAILSTRELLVLEKVLQGTTYRTIAEQLEITESSVKTYMRRILEKTGTTNKKNLLHQLSQPQRQPLT